jgi:branched-subunit amino acid transport protein
MIKNGCDVCNLQILIALWCHVLEVASNGVFFTKQNTKMSGSLAVIFAVTSNNVFWRVYRLMLSRDAMQE